MSLNSWLFVLQNQTKILKVKHIISLYGQQHKYCQGLNADASYRKKCINLNIFSID